MVGLEFRFRGEGVRSVWDDSMIGNWFSCFRHNTRDTNAQGMPFGGDEGDPPE